MKRHIPLLSPRPFAVYSAQEYHTYIRSLYRTPAEAAGKPEPREFSFRRNDKGNPVITIRRKPKYLTKAEVNLCALELGMPQNEMWVYLRDRDVEIRNDDLLLVKPKRKAK